jgi:hypothetical protein
VCRELIQVNRYATDCAQSCDVKKGEEDAPETDRGIEAVQKGGGGRGGKGDQTPIGGRERYMKRARGEPSSRWIRAERRSGRPRVAQKGGRRARGGMRHRHTIGSAISHSGW